VWSSTITYVVELSPSDANGNGIQDDYRLVRTQAGAMKRILCSDIQAGGFVAVRTANSIVLNLQLERKRDGRLYRRTATTSVNLRN
jgi:hypothetical protein